MPTRLASDLLAWYAKNQRQLPWRHTRDPYAIWVSEVMLQQTRVETVAPYYRRWLRRYPTVKRLARARAQGVLAAWEGLGYYRRALQLRRTAQAVVRDYGGKLPQSVEQLRRLPGIGPYTAAAVPAFAFGADEIALDGNLRRVLARLIDLPVDPRTPDGEARLLRQARRHLPSGKASAFNQALMDLGAQVCLPRHPQCEICPLRWTCWARIRGVQEARPVRAQKSPAPQRIATAGVIRRRGRGLIGRRPEGGLLGGLGGFPGGEGWEGETGGVGWGREVREELGVAVEVGASLGIFQHSYTHFHVTMHAFECRIRRGRPRAYEHTDLRWVIPSRLAAYPMGRVARRIADVVAGEPALARRPILRK